MKRRWPRAGSAVAVAVLIAALAACAGSPAADPSASPSGPASSSAPSAPPTGEPTPAPTKPSTSPSTQEPVADQIKIAISIKNGKVDPSGKKIDVPQGTTVVLMVTSDEDDEIHAHTGSGDGFSLEVKADQPTEGQFTVQDSGSFEVESHHLDKIIVILNVR